MLAMVVASAIPAVAQTSNAACVLNGSVYDCTVFPSLELLRCPAEAPVEVGDTLACRSVSSGRRFTCEVLEVFFGGEVLTAFCRPVEAGAAEAPPGSAGAPAVTQEFDQEISESGDVEQSFRLSGEGDNSNLCVAPSQFANTGNLQNQQGIVQYFSEDGEVEFEESTQIAIRPELESVCDQKIEQAAAA